MENQEMLGQVLLAILTYSDEVEESYVSFEEAWNHYREAVLRLTNDSSKEEIHDAVLLSLKSTERMGDFMSKTKKLLLVISALPPIFCDFD